MCTSFVYNGNKTLIGWNLDILDMDYKVVEEESTVYIAIHDATQGWLPLFGVNKYGDFIAMPTCWPFDARSNPTKANDLNVMMINIELLIGKRRFLETKELVEKNPVYSIPGVTFQSQLSDIHGNVLQIIPGQGHRYFEKPNYQVLTNFSPFKGNSELHPWMGIDRYEIAVKMIEEKCENLDVDDCFSILQATSQVVCPTVVSMVFDASEHIIYWCENRNFNKINSKHLNLEV